MKNAVTVMVILIFFLIGCALRDDRGSLKNQIATTALVICDHCPDFLSRSYEDDEAVDALLCYIRSLGPLSPALFEPHPAEPRQATILFTMADGSKRIYHQRGNDYLRIDHGPWLQIPAGRGIHLWQLLLNMPKEPDK